MVKVSKKLRNLKANSKHETDFDALIRKLKAEGVISGRRGQVIHLDHYKQYAFINVDGVKHYLPYRTIEGGGRPYFLEWFRVEVDDAFRVVKAARIEQKER